MDESFILKLVNVSGGTINQSADAAVIKIQANDHPYGLFNFQRSMLYTNEANKTIPITINREKGTAGTVRVFYNFGKLFTANVAEENKDFIHANGFVNFFDGEKQKNATVTILDDDVPEVNESFLLNITHVTVLNKTGIKSYFYISTLQLSNTHLVGLCLDILVVLYLILHANMTKNLLLES